MTPEDPLYSGAEPLLEAHPDLDPATLPGWVAERLDEARVYGAGKKGVILPDGRKYHLDNRLNDMTGREWNQFIRSVFVTHYPTRGKEAYAHHIRKCHPTPKPPQLMRDLIAFFTKAGGLVLDPFMGVGGTLLGAALCGRRACGVDLNPLYLDAYRAAAAELALPDFPAVCADALALLRDRDRVLALTGGQPVDLLLTDPPYANMMRREKTGGDVAVYGRTATPFTASDLDLGNLSLPDFLARLREAVSLALPYLKPRGYVVLFIKDLQPHRKETNLLHAQVVAALNELPALYYKGMKIWADQSTKPYPYGYPFSFVANQIHQYILVFRKEK